MRAVIVAAGMSTRMYPVAKGIPKCLLDVDGCTMLWRSVYYIKKHISDVAVVVGYKADLIEDRLGNEVTYIYNPFYEYCNNMASLWMAKDFVGKSPFLYLHSDVVFQPYLLRGFLNSGFGNSMVLDSTSDEYNEEAMKAVVDTNGNIIRSSKDIDKETPHTEWIGMAKFDYPELLFNVIDRLLREGNLLSYDTLAFSDPRFKEHVALKAYFTNSQWAEVDYPGDYEWVKNQKWI